MIHNFTNLENEFDDKPWLILGKGPTFERFLPIKDPDRYNILALNEAGERCKSDISLVIDLEPLSEKLLWNTKHLLVPVYPHINCKVSKDSLDWHYCENKVLIIAQFNHILFGYNLSTYKGKEEIKFPLVTAKYFSVEAAFDILGILGVKEIYSLGIDGGTAYAKTFYPLKPLTNGRLNFDAQFKEIDKKVKKYAMTYQKL